MPAPPPESEPAMIRIRAVGVTLSAFDPRPGAKFSMCTVSSLGRQFQKKGSRGRPDGLANIVHDALHQRRVVAFRHHPDQGLGPGLADNEPSPSLKLGLRGGYPAPHPVGFKRLAATAEANILEKLWKRLELVQQLACRRAPFDEGGENLECRNEAVTGRRIIGKDDMPGLFAADIAAAKAH